MTNWEYHMKNSNFLAGAIASFVLAFAPQAGMAQEDDAPPPILFTNVNVFDGFQPRPDHERQCSGRGQCDHASID